MNTDDELKLKPVYVREATYSTDNEINLIDILLTLAKRRTLIIKTMALVLIIGITFAFLLPRTYAYSVTIETGSQLVGNMIIPFEASSTALAKLQYNHIPQTLDSYYKSHKNTSMKYKVTSSTPNSGSTILLTITGTEKEASTINALLDKITLKASQDHHNIYTNLKNAYEANITKASQKLANTFSNSDAITTQLEIIERNTNQLVNLRNTTATGSPLRSIEPSGISRKIIIAITIILAITLSLLTAYAAEIIDKVKVEEKKRKEKENKVKT